MSHIEKCICSGLLKRYLSWVSLFSTVSSILYIWYLSKLVNDQFYLRIFGLLFSLVFQVQNKLIKKDFFPVMPVQNCKYLRCTQDNSFQTIWSTTLDMAHLYGWKFADTNCDYIGVLRFRNVPVENKYFFPQPWQNPWKVGTGTQL